MEVIDNLVEERILKTPQIIQAFREISREDFVPEGLERHARLLDSALSIGFGQTVSQPLTVAFMLELLEPKAGQKILDIGFGSGWSTSLLAHIVSSGSKTGHVYAIERVKELCDFGRENIAKYNFIKNGVVDLFCFDASLGLLKFAPFDRIIAAASLQDEIPKAWREQVGLGGIIVAPIRQSIWRFKKITVNQWQEEEYSGFVFVPFIKDKNSNG